MDAEKSSIYKSLQIIMCIENVSIVLRNYISTKELSIHFFKQKF